MAGGPSRVGKKRWALAVVAVGLGLLASAWFAGTTFGWMSGTLDAQLSITTANEFPSPTVPASATPAATPTATPIPCGATSDASLEFRPDELEIGGTGPIDASIVIANDGNSSAALDVLLGLTTTDGAVFLDRVQFGNGQLWLIGGQPSTTLYLAGNIPAGGRVEIPFTLYMTPAWGQLHDEAESKIRVDVTSARCLKKPSKARLTIDIERGNGAGDHE